jgi:hypothetical protein
MNADFQDTDIFNFDHRLKRPGASHYEERSDEAIS